MKEIAMEKTPKINRNVVLAGAEEAFFKAMIAGYAGGGKTRGLNVEVQKIRNGKMVIVRLKDYMVIDEWRTTPYSDCSAGTTTIFFRNAPVWWMSYGGSYSKEAIPFLKMALARAYEKGKFCGGRGPEQFKNGLFLYSNYVRLKDFTRFQGREEIRRLKVAEVLGFHEYLGMALI
jgi:hypothetical protein